MENKNVLNIDIGKNLIERIELRATGNNISILYRPIHNYIHFVTNDEEGKREIKKLCEMSRDDFAKFLKGCRAFPRITKDSIEKISKTDNEKWYQTAWKAQTNDILKELNIQNPIEEPIYTVASKEQIT